MSQEQLFASFVLDRHQGLEIALHAEQVTEATPVCGSIQRLPGSIDFLEGFMHLREHVIPVINLKKRLGLAEHDYRADAKVAVISLADSRFGLLFDDIKEVFRAESSLICPINRVLQTEDRIISALIQLEPGKRAVELLDVASLFKGGLADLDKLAAERLSSARSAETGAASHYVIFKCRDQEYGVEVKYAQEITFCTEIDEMFRTDIVQGALELRGTTIPVINAGDLLGRGRQEAAPDSADTRVLVLASEECSFGMIVEEVTDIVMIADDGILPFPGGSTAHVRGLYSRSDSGSIILLNMYDLVCSQLDNIKSMSRLGRGTGNGKPAASPGASRTHHLITENCYLVFSIGKHFAIELKDVREIIEPTGVMTIPGATGYSTSVINLRGQVVPVVDLRRFYNYPVQPTSEIGKLIICTGYGQTVALEVDRIVTIYKQEQFHATPSLNPQLRDKKDTADRLIEYLDGDGLKEHVLVVNCANLVRNHLKLDGGSEATPVDADKREKREKLSNLRNEG